MSKRKVFSPEQIIMKLREADVLLAQKKRVAEICRVIEISEQTYYRWRKEYGGLNTTQVKKMKELERENARLKNLVADLSLDNAILKRCSQKSSQPGTTSSSSRSRSKRDRCVRATRLPGTWSSPLNPTIPKAYRRR